MSISAKMVKELRDATGAGMADCKKALEQTEGNFDEAIEFLRKKGAASAAKRADKEANEGLVTAIRTDDGKKAVITEITCETDFVAKNQEFVDYANTITNEYLNNEIADVSALKALSISDKSIEDYHNEILSKFSEKIDINRIVKFESNGYIENYIHSGSKLGVLLSVSSDKLNDESKALVKDIAMQIAAMKPISIDRSGVSQEILDKEKEIYRDQAIQEGKPSEIADRVAHGRVEKFYKESCLIEQVFVKDSKKTIADIVKQISDQAGEEVKITEFSRISIGE
ncbi:translation elongation factor Ts [Candidatus Kapabacteria bacterium]|nr:translation elongation factor Ts [Candidatus Kapabacteria bacterium]